MSIIHKNFIELFSIDNIFSAWLKFRRGKASKFEVMEFERHLEDNIYELYQDIRNKKYKHGVYSYFQIFDNKKRDIYKAKIRDRIVHQIIFDYLNYIYEPIFISDSYSSRINKGQYKAINQLKYFIKLNNFNCFVLKCDIKKYFNSVDHDILLEIIERKIVDEEIYYLIKKIIKSFPQKGIPLGNITSQIFANIYLNELDYFVKNNLKCRFYIRYNDDFIILLENKNKLISFIPQIKFFVSDKLNLEIPDNKISIRKISQGMDFLGFNILRNAVLLRNKTKGKIYNNISNKNVISYMGILKHCNSYNLKRKILAMDKIKSI